MSGEERSRPSGDGSFLSEGCKLIEETKRILDSVLREIRYVDLHAALARERTVQGLVAAGWFPFLELMSAEFLMLLEGYESAFGLRQAEAELIGRFDEARLNRMFARWMQLPHLKARDVILAGAVGAFKAEDPLPVIKTVLTEIEGLMSDAYFKSKGERADRIPVLLDFMTSAVGARAGSEGTLFFPIDFGKYLKGYVYAGCAYDGLESVGSRLSVGHGDLAREGYLMARALKSLLTLDQISFYS